MILHSSSALRRHEQIHVPFRAKFTCQVCNMTISRKDHLWRHLRRKHGVHQGTINVESLKCPFCNERLLNMTMLMIHVEQCHPHIDNKD
uniref:C2H2-type domain-containing protein n=1 Tax=Ornithodoros turicata TaxID=34597 RepID=A0A2R5L4C1_9ACAR